MTWFTLRPSSVTRRSALLGVVLLAAVVSCSPQPPAQAEKPEIVIFNLVTYPILDESIAGIRQSLERHGYDADSIEIRELNAGGQMSAIDGMAREALATNPDVIIPVSTPVAQAVARGASADQRIVFSTVTNPDDIGFNAQTRNLTGVSDAVNYQANIDLIRAIFPNTARIGTIYNPSERNSQFGVERMRAITGQANLNLVTVTATNSSEVIAAVRSLRGRVDVLYLGSDNTVASAIEGVIATAAELHLPVIASDAGSVEQGALASVSVDYTRLGNQVGDIVADVLKNNRNPRDIPPVSYVGDSLVLNRSAAAALGITFPQALIDRQPRFVE